MGENQNPREACAPGTTSSQAAPWAMFSALGSWDTAKLKYHIFIIDSILCFKNLRTSIGRHAVRAKSLQLCSTLCDPMDCSPPGSSVHGILQARILEWLPFSSPGDLPDPGIESKFLMSPAQANGFFNTSATWEAQHRHKFA